MMIHELIYYRGLNCHLASVINMAAAMGINYKEAFYNLWSETDFIHDTAHHMYLSKRVFPNLERLGAKLETLYCPSNTDREEGFSTVLEGELFLIGADTFHIPWSPVFENFHGHHYFFAYKERAGSLLCFDPTYGKTGQRLKSCCIVPYAFEFGRLHKVAVEPPQSALVYEAEAILANYQKLQEDLCQEINSCRDREQKNMASLLKQITALVNNRYLFKHYLRQYQSYFDDEEIFFNKDFFSKWDAVKNGLYKVSITRGNEKAACDAQKILRDLILKEAHMAKEMIVMDKNRKRV